MEGECKYNGKIGYMPQNLWLKKETITNNILFGEPYNAELL